MGLVTSMFCKLCGAPDLKCNWWLQVRMRALPRVDQAAVLQCRAQLAAASSRLGRAADALEMQRDVLQARMDLLGPEHQDTLQVRQHPRRLVWSLHRVAASCLAQQHHVLSVWVRTQQDEVPEGLWHACRTPVG
jgi:hypothetical protein